jgi:hypothetical protein
MPLSEGTTIMSDKLRLVLGIVSGSVSAANLTADQYQILGYDTYRFGYYGPPSEEDVKYHVEEYLYRLLSKLLTANDI